ncbi:MAG TPA: M14 metallopeptidase family protein [Vicinamibacterales bacterium]
MNARSMRRLMVLLPLLVLFVAAGALAQGKITTPKEFLGFDAGDDYVLANYTQLKGYWEKLAQESNRMKLVEIGKTAEGRPMIMAIFTSPDNQKNLARYKEISQRLARAEGLTDEQARKLAAEGKAVIWIDGGLHATECVPAQHLFQIAYQMASKTDAETLRFLNDVILLVVPVNPDGMELVSNWYMRDPDPKKRSMNIPRLYQKYVGHDNNRDSYANNQPETEAISRQQFIEWNPQIMYNQHQTGPAGTVLFMAPFRDPFNYNYDPLVPEGIEVVGAAIHQRFITEGKPGAVQRAAASYSTWFNGSVRTTTGFHNQIGLLSEIVGNPTPVSIPFIPARQLPDGNQPFPIQPQQVWHQRQSIEYLLTADRAIMDLASKDREGFLYRSYVMGRNSIERGSKDTWTITPKRIAAVQAAIAKDMGPQNQAQGPTGGDFAGQVGGGLRGGVPAKYYEILREPARRDPRGFILTADQPDFLTATRFVNALLKSGVVIHRATAPFQAAGKSYPAGSYVVKTAQAFRPHVMDMFEPQDHPDDIPYPGGAPRPPYDATGWTLAFQMGVQFDRILDGFDGPFERIPDVIKTAPGKVSAGKAVAGYVLSHQQNDAFVATNRLLAAKEEVFWLKSPLKVGTSTYPAGAIYVPAKPTTRKVLDKIAADLGMNIESVSAKPTGDALKLKLTRVALWDRYGGSMDSGWIRWIFEQAYPTTVEVVYAPTLDAGDLNAKYDVIIFPNGSIPALAGEGGGRRGGGGGQAGPNPADIPEEFRGRLGNISIDKTIPQLKKFVENGGTIIAIGSGTSIAGHFGLPIGNHLAERQPNGTERRLGGEKFYVPGSLLQVAVDATNPLAFGVGNKVDVFFDNSPVFRLDPDAALKGVKSVAWFDSPTPLRSGWAWGQQYLDGGAAMVEATVGKGKVLLFGPEVMFRGQPHGTFKFVFNGIYYGSATPVNLGAPKK